MKPFRILILCLATLACIAIEVWLSVPGLWQMVSAGGDAVPIKRVGMAVLAVTVPPAAVTCWRRWRHVASRGAILLIAGSAWGFALSIAIEGAYATAKQKASVASAPADKARSDWIAADKAVKDKEDQIQLITEIRPARQLKSMMNDDSISRTKAERKKLADAFAAATERERLQSELPALRRERTTMALKIGTTDGSATLLGQAFGGMSNHEVIEVGQSLLLLLVVSLLPEGLRHTWTPPRAGRTAVPASPFEEWADEFLIADHGAWMKSKDAAGHYTRWVIGQSAQPDKSFYKMLSSRCVSMGGRRARIGDARGWSGVRLQK